MVRCGAAVVATCLLLSGCGGKTYVRGTEVEDLDDPAMSTGLDKRDLEKLLHENLQSMMTSTTARQWNATKSRPKVAIYPLANETTEHVDSQLQALLADVETYLVDSGLVQVISVERQRQMIAEVEKQHGGHFDPNHIVEYNRQLGAEFYVTGKVFAADERTDEGRRVQYFMFMQLIEVATSAIAWQHKSMITKGLIDAD
ncbi:MAG: penicillin-binding protein activator LpoB [Deltaproteobacteria bacterium]|nr:penicillin-binding protein activator LpoB [Deltaproteobacteria bacterium]MBW2536139.1 penicillin-binding protein activator LpoB [Deltaproteobacteria bacterium]